MQTETNTDRNGFTKLAERRRAGYPIGVRAPMYLQCACGNEVDLDGFEPATCVCGQQYEARGPKGWRTHGWLVNA